MALGKLERQEIERRILEADRLLREDAPHTEEEARLYRAVEHMLHALRIMAGAMD